MIVVFIFRICDDRLFVYLFLYVDDMLIAERGHLKFSKLKANLIKNLR